MNPWIAMIASLVFLAVLQLGGTMLVLWLAGARRKTGH